MDAAGDEVGGGVEAAVDDGDDVVESPFARMERTAAIKTAVGIAGENARAKIFVAKMVGTRPRPRLPVRIAERMKHQRSKLIGGRGGTQALENFVGEEN